MQNVTFGGKKNVQQLQQLKRQERQIRQNSFIQQKPPGQNYFHLKNQIDALRQKENDQRSTLRKLDPMMGKILSALGFKPRQPIKPSSYRQVFKPTNDQFNAEKPAIKPPPAKNVGLFSKTRQSAPGSSAKSTGPVTTNRQQQNDNDDWITQQTWQQNWFNQQQSSHQHESAPSKPDYCPPSEHKTHQSHQPEPYCPPPSESHHSSSHDSGSSYSSGSSDSGSSYDSGSSESGDSSSFD